MFWLFAQFPQLIENTKRGNSDSLSLIFLANWLTGDFANLIGCIFTNQLPFQTYLAMYFVFIDTSLFVQSLYFRLKKSRQALRNYGRDHDDDTTNGVDNHDDTTNGRDHDNDTRVDIDEETPLLSSSDPNYASLSILAIGFLFSSINKTEDPLTSSTVKLLTEPSPLIDSSYQLGRLFSWICCAFYLSSRLPQIYRNFERRSCNGLAMSMFGCALMGNVTYSASILTKSLDPLYLYNALPYLLGSGGTVIFDIVIFTQYLAYNGKSEES